ERDRNERTIFSPTDRIEMIDFLTATNAGEHFVFFALTIVRNDRADRMSDHLDSGIAEHPLGCAIPRRDNAVQILADDRIVARRHDSRQSVRGERTGLAAAGYRRGVNLRIRHDAVILAVSVRGRTRLTRCSHRSTVGDRGENADRSAAAGGLLRAGRESCPTELSKTRAVPYRRAVQTATSLSPELGTVVHFANSASVRLYIATPAAICLQSCMLARRSIAHARSALQSRVLAQQNQFEHMPSARPAL